MALPASALEKRSKTTEYLLGLIALLLAAALAFWLYKYQTTGELSQQVEQLSEQNQDLTTTNQRITTELNTLKQQWRDQQQATAIQQSTEQTLQQQLETLQNDVIELNQALDFYQNIVQGSQSTKLQIRDLFIYQDSDQPQHYRYRLVITQGKKIRSAITGEVELKLTASQNDKAISIDMGQHALKLRHVQVLEGQIELDKEIIPKTVHVTLKQKKKSAISKDIDWKITSHPTQIEKR